MDTSHDFESQTFDFLIGNGNNLPSPSHADYSHVLFKLGLELRYWDLLSNVIGHYPIRDNAVLQRVVKIFESSGIVHDHNPWDMLRAQSVLEFEETESDARYHVILYLGEVGLDVTWISVKVCTSGPSRGKIVDCAELDVDTMAKFFARYMHLKAKFGRSIGQTALSNLEHIIGREAERRRAKLQGLEKALAIVGPIVERASRMDQRAASV